VFAVDEEKTNKSKREGEKREEEGNSIKNKNAPHRPTTTAPKKEKTENPYLIWC
jgi:hypothetical protein